MHRLSIWAAIGLAFLGVLGVSGYSSGYEEIDINNGGTISGKVTLKGPIPDARVFPAVLYPFGPFCQKNRVISDGKGHIFLKDVVMGPDQGLKDVVVAIEGVARGKHFEPIVANILVKDCEFSPFVSVVQNHSTFTMKNEDPVLHNSQLYQAEKGNVILNVPIPPNSTDTHPIHFEKNKRIYKMICGMHEFMQTWGFAVDNPYYVLTDRNGRFMIDELPPGTYKVIVWHPTFKPIEREITVKAGKTILLNFEFDSGEVERSPYETQKQFRIGP